MSFDDKNQPPWYPEAMPDYMDYLKRVLAEDFVARMGGRDDIWTEEPTTGEVMDSIQRIVARSRAAYRNPASDRQKVNDLIRQNPGALAHILVNGTTYPLRSAQTNEGGEVIRPAMLYGVPLDPDVVEMVKLEMAYISPSTED